MTEYATPVKAVVSRLLQSLWHSLERSVTQLDDVGVVHELNAGGGGSHVTDHNVDPACPEHLSQTLLRTLLREIHTAEECGTFYLVYWRQV